MSLSIEQAADLERSYKPHDPQTLQRLAQASLAPFVGPTAVGKNYAMRQSGYYQVGGITTRPLRANDPENLRHVSLREALTAIEEGSLVQFAVSLKTDTIYATSPDDYTVGNINTKDIFARSIENFYQYGFKGVRPVAAVVRPLIWKTRLDTRFKNLPYSEVDARLDEAQESLEWILGDSRQTGEKVVIIADDEHASDNARRISAFVEGGESVDPDWLHIDTAEQMLQKIPSLRRRYWREKRLARFANFSVINRN